MGPRAPHTKRGERIARRHTAEDWHRAGDHDVYQMAGCALCERDAYIRWPAY